MSEDWARWLAKYRDPRVPSSLLEDELDRLVALGDCGAMEYARLRNLRTRLPEKSPYPPATCIAGCADVASNDGALKTPFSGLWRPPKSPRM